MISNNDLMQKQELMEMMNYMNGCGIRTTGSPAHKRFVGFIKEQIESMGVDVYTDTNYFKRWEEKPAKRRGYMTKQLGKELIIIKNLFYGGYVMKKFFSLFLSVILLLSTPVFVCAEEIHSGLPEIHISLADGLTLETVNSGSKDTKYLNNTVTLTDSDKSENTFENVEFKGRGNYTWNVPRMIKKPYQIKFGEKTKVFGFDKAKKWVLLANYSDATLMRNKLVFDAATKIGIPAPENTWADVFVNDEYIGNYLLCEKNEIGKGRVGLSDEYGVLCEIDGNYGLQEDMHFRTDIDNTVVVLSDSVADDVGEENSISEKAFEMFRQKLNKFESVVYSEKASYAEIASLIDVDSFVKYYFIQELTEDPDGLRSSFFLYSDGENDVIHLGPLWDYDSALGAYATESLGGNTGVDYSLNIKTYMGASSVDWFKKLFKHEEFSEYATDVYNSEIKPVFEKMTAMIDDYLYKDAKKTAFYSSAEMNFVRWDSLLGTESVFGSNGHSYGTTFESEVEYLKTWITNRVEYLNNRYAAKNEPENPTEPPKPTEPTKPAEPAKTCSKCGGTHPNNFWGQIVCFFNRIGNWFRNLFK